MTAYNFLPPRRRLAPGLVPGADAEPSGFQFPGPTDRLTCNGMTGSGKSTFALWLFAEGADFDKKPWVFLDYKGEELIAAALKNKLFEPLAIDQAVPRRPGIFVVRPNARAGQTPVVDFLWGIYEKGRTGVFLDEATMVPELRGEANSGGPFQSLLSQGRSKNIPVWVLAQRPVNVNNMVFTENNYYSAFEVASEDDLKKITKHIPRHSLGYDKVWDPDLILKDHWSRWYDRKQKKSFLLRPCPPADKIFDILAERVDKMKKRETL